MGDRAMEFRGNRGHHENQDEEIEGVESPSEEAREERVRGVGRRDRAHLRRDDIVGSRIHGVQCLVEASRRIKCVAHQTIAPHICLSP